MALADACNSTTFAPSLFGAEILSLQASLVTDYNVFVDARDRRTQPSIDVKDASFCNITVTYTHPWLGDNVIVEAWLPVNNWNGIFQAVGGGGWKTGRYAGAYSAMAGAIADGYATVTTDGGLGTTSDPSPWVLLSPGNVNMYYLQNFATTSLNDQVRLVRKTESSKVSRTDHHASRLFSESPSFEAFTAEIPATRTGTAARREVGRASHWLSDIQTPMTALQPELQ